MEKRKQIEEILLNDYGCFDDFTVDKLLDLFSVSKRCSNCLYRKYRPNAKHKYELNECQISGHNLTDVENYSCEHYKPIPNVC